jgi:hypothetical protein
MLALSFVTIMYWDTHFTWWAMIICIIIPVIFVVPIGIIFATTNIQIGLNVITDFIIGYMLPGRPLAMMMFKAYGVLFSHQVFLVRGKGEREMKANNLGLGYIVMAQAQYFLQDLKLGHYLKVPPKSMFFAQSCRSSPPFLIV